MGSDVPTWVEERLVDSLILGSGNIDCDVEAFKNRTAGTGILVYPCVYGWPSGYNIVFGFEDSEPMLRALAANYWGQGADGIYTFNWNAHSYVHRPDKNSQFTPLIQLLREIDAPQAMRGKDKLYAADRLLGEKPMLPHNWLHATLPQTLKRRGQVDIPILVGEDLTESSLPPTIWLSLTYTDLTGISQIEATLNKQPLSKLEPTDPWLPPDNTDTTLQQGEVHALHQEISPDLLIRGKNRVGISVVAGEVTVQGVEIHVLY